MAQIESAGARQHFLPDHEARLKSRARRIHSLVYGGTPARFHQGHRERMAGSPGGSKARPDIDQRPADRGAEAGRRSRRQRAPGAGAGCRHRAHQGRAGAGHPYRKPFSNALLGVFNSYTEATTNPKNLFWSAGLDTFVEDTWSLKLWTTGRRFAGGCCELSGWTPHFTISAADLPSDATSSPAATADERYRQRRRSPEEDGGSWIQRGSKNAILPPAPLDLEP